MKMLAAVAAVGMWGCSETSAQRPHSQSTEVIQAWGDFARVCEAIGPDEILANADRACFETIENNGRPPDRILHLSLNDPAANLPKIRANIADRCRLVGLDKLDDLKGVCQR